MKKFSKDLDRYFVCRAIPTKAQKGGYIMTVKQLKKQLAAAIAMVVVSVVALSSSTYAWFASNNKVAATGMQVQATAEGGIEIAAYSGSVVGAYSTTANAEMSSAQTLYPTSTLATATDGSIDSSWYHASAASASSFEAKAGTYETLSLSNGKDANDKYYYVEKKFNIRSVSSTKLAQDLKVSKLTVTGNSDVLDKSLRVAVVSGSSVALYAPCGYTSSESQTSVSYKVATSVDGSGNALMPGENNVTALFSDRTSGVIASGNVPNSAGVDVKVYIWYEGEDANHFSNNLDTTIDTISLSIDFEATI